METKKIKIWNKTFKLPVTFDCYPGETITSQQKEALEWIIRDPELIWQALEPFKAYLKREYDWKEEKGQNIFEVLQPESLFIPHKQTKPTAALFFESELDPEHGFTAVFENGKLKEVGTQDVIL